MKALIYQNKVIQVEDKEFPVAPSLQWVECQPGVAPGWHYDGASFVAPTRSDDSEDHDLEKLRAIDLASIAAIRAVLVDGKDVAVEALQHLYGLENDARLIRERQQR